MTNALPRKSMRKQFDRLCERFPRGIAAHVPWNVSGPRGDLNLERDGSQHCRYQSLYDDLLN